MYLELDKAIVDLFKNNLSWQLISGATETDPRIYSWFPSGDTTFVLGTKDVAVIYHFSIVGRPGRWSYPYQIPDMQLFLRLLSTDQLKLGQATKILIGENFLDQKSIDTDEISVKHISLLSANKGLNEGAPTQPIHVTNFSFRFSNVFIRSGYVKQKISSLDAILESA